MARALLFFFFPCSAALTHSFFFSCLRNFLWLAGRNHPTLRIGSLPVLCRGRFPWMCGGLRLPSCQLRPLTCGQPARNSTVDVSERVGARGRENLARACPLSRHDRVLSPSSGFWLCFRFPKPATGVGCCCCKLECQWPVVSCWRPQAPVAWLPLMRPSRLLTCCSISSSSGQTVHERGPQSRQSPHGIRPPARFRLPCCLLGS